MMKKYFFLLISFFLMNTIFSQEKWIQITNKSTGKTIVIKEHKRIRVKTFDGKKFSGKFTIIKKDVIKIKSKEIHFKDIEKLKRNPLLISIIINGTLMYFGVATSFLSFAFAAWAGDGGYLLGIIPGAALIYAGVNSPNLLRGYKSKKGWKYEIITLTKK